jgi:chromosome segregation ATPase
MNTVQQALLSRLSALEAIQLEESKQNSVLATALSATDKRQTMIENNHSTIESDLASIQKDLLCQQSVLKSMNRTECELSELSIKISSIDFTLKSTEKTHSERIDGLNENLCSISAISDRISVEIENQERELTIAINHLSFVESTVESTERDSRVLLFHHTTNETAISKLDSIINHLRNEVELLSALRPTQEALSIQTDRTESALTHIASEFESVNQLRADISILKAWKESHSRIVCEFPSLFDDFRTKRWSLI